MSDAADAMSAQKRRLTLEAWVIPAGIGAIVAILALAAFVLFYNLPSADAFNSKVERIFVENDDLTSQAEIKLLEILAQSGTSFSEVLASYRFVIFVLLIFATALMVASFVFILTIIALNRRMGEVERAGIQINSLIVSREARQVLINNMEFSLTEEIGRAHV